MIRASRAGVTKEYSKEANEPQLAANDCETLAIKFFFKKSVIAFNPCGNG